MGAVRVHDRHPGRAGDPVDDYGYGPLLDRAHRPRPLDLGEIVTLPDGSRWPVVSSRIWRTGLGWRQAVAVDVPAAEPVPVTDWTALHRLAGQGMSP